MIAGLALAAGALLVWLPSSRNTASGPRPDPTGKSTAPSPGGREPIPSGPGREIPDQGPGPGTASAGGDLAPLSPSPPSPNGGDAGGSGRTPQTGDGSAPPPSFEGTGVLRGHVGVEGNAPFPPRWTLVVRPSRTLPGSEHAEMRRIELEEADFRVEGLALGGYDVRAEAPGFNAFDHPILLEKRSPSRFLNLVIAPAGFLEGSVVNARGEPLEGVEIRLAPQPEGDALVETSDVLGRYRFDELPDGHYRLSAGPADRPVGKPRLLRFRRPGMTMPPIELPEASTLTVLVVDPYGQPVPGATVRAGGEDGGSVEGTTDADGLLALARLDAGHYRIAALHPDHGTGKAAVEVSDREPAAVTVRLDP